MIPEGGQKRLEELAMKARQRDMERRAVVVRAVLANALKSSLDSVLTPQVVERMKQQVTERLAGLNGEGFKVTVEPSGPEELKVTMTIPAHLCPRELIECFGDHQLPPE